MTQSERFYKAGSFSKALLYFNSIREILWKNYLKLHFSFCGKKSVLNFVIDNSLKNIFT